MLGKLKISTEWSKEVCKYPKKCIKEVYKPNEVSGKPGSWFFSRAASSWLNCKQQTVSFYCSFMFWEKGKRRLFSSPFRSHELRFDCQPFHLPRANQTACSRLFLTNKMFIYLSSLQTLSLSPLVVLLSFSLFVPFYFFTGFIAVSDDIHVSAKALCNIFYQLYELVSD